MKKVLLLALIFSATSCVGNPFTKTGSNDPIVQKQVESKLTVEEGDTVAVDYIGRLEDGTIFDSSIQSEAKKSTNYSEGRTYEPYVFSAKEGGGSITGFWKGVIGMKV